MQFTDSLCHNVVSGCLVTRDSSPTPLPRPGTHRPLWDVKSGGTTEAVCLVDQYAWREPLILQQQEVPHLVEEFSLGKQNPLARKDPETSMDPPPSPTWGTLETPDPPCYVTHFSLQLNSQVFSTVTNTTHPNQLPKLWISSPALAPRAMKLWKERGNLIPSQFTTCMAGRLLDRPRGGTELPASNAHSQNSFWETNIFQVLMSNSDFTICPLKLIIYQHENKDNLNSFYVVFWSGLHPGIM